MSSLAERVRDRKKIMAAWTVLYFPAAVFFMELVFKLSTAGGPYGLPIIYSALYSAALGTTLFLLSALFPGRGRRIAGTVFLAAAGILFTVEFFVFRAFKVFYDINTVTAGAGGVLGQFGGEIARLVFCFDGIAHLLLFFLPAVLFFVFPGELPALNDRARGWFLALTGVIAVFLFTGKLIMLSPVHGPVFRSEYNFQRAVPEFGLMTALRLDVREMNADSSGGFEYGDGTFADPGALSGDGAAAAWYAASASGNVSGTSASGGKAPAGAADAGNAAADGRAGENGDMPGTGTPSDALESGKTGAESGDPAPAEPAKPVEYGWNVMDIDFEALAAQGSSQEAELDRYVMSQVPSRQNEYTGLFRGKNLIMITAEGFSGDIISEELTPTLWRLSRKGFRFTDYIMPATAGTTGGEFEHIFGLYPTAGGRSMQRMVGRNNYFTMGFQLNRLGYYGKMYHNNDWTYYNRDQTHFSLGYSNGFMGYGNGMEKFVKPVWPESDVEMFEGTVPDFLDRQPFNIYYMTVSGHSNYSYNANDMSKKNWDRVQELPYSDTIKAYYAANLELENALTYLVGELEKAGIEDDTVICLTADHFPYGLDHDAPLGHLPYLSELYGYEVKNYMQRDHNTWILWCGCLEDREPVTIDAPTSVIDILPTLSNLFGTEWDSRLLPGRDVLSDAEPLAFNLAYDWKTTLGTYLSSKGKFYPVDENAEIPEDYVKQHQTIVRNKISYMKGVIGTDYFRHLFGPVETPVPHEDPVRASGSDAARDGAE